MKPVTKTTEEVFSKILDERTKDLNTKLDEISAKMTSKPKEEKIEDIIRKMKDRVPEKIVKREQEIVREPVKESVKEPIKESIKEPEHVHDDVFCPSCNRGHVHKMESSGLKMKCTDGNCGEELFVIPKSADYACANCGFPIKKPTDEKVLDGCPFCHNPKAVPFDTRGKPPLLFDFSKMKK